jgi:hypothetical protein
MSLVEETTLVKSGEKAASKATKSKKDVGDEEEERPVERKSSSDPTKKIAFVRTAARYTGGADDKLASENDRLRKQRDTYSKQFDELSRIRNTDSEKLFDKYKQNVEVQTKGQLLPPPCLDSADDVAQTEIIETMTKLNEKQSTRIAALEKSLAAAQKAAEAAASAPASLVKAEPAPVASTSTLGKSDLKELKALRDEVTGLRKGVKEKDQKSKLLLPQESVREKADIQ